MTLIKTSLLNAIAVAVKMLTLLGLNKILAIYIGPAGYAAIGNFQNAVQMITTFASGAINTGVVKYTAEYSGDETKQHAVWRTAGTIAVIGSVFTSIFTLVFSQNIALWFLKDEKLGIVFVCFAVTLILYILNTLLLAILNGKKEIRSYVISNILGSILSLIATSLMAIFLGLKGVLIALAIYPAFSFFVTIFICCKANWFKFSYIFGRLDKNILLNLAKFTAMALTSAACVPVSHMLIRNHIGVTLGWEAAGYWEAMWRLSAAYLMLVTTTLNVYYLPRLSELENPQDIKNEIFQGYRIILPISVICSFLVYFFRDFIIGVLFTEDFFPMRDLFAWQLVGDTLKIGSWILAFLILGKAMVHVYIFTEIIFCLGFYILTCFLTEFMGLRGVSLAYAVNYFLYWIFISLFLIYKMKNIFSENK